MATIRTRTGADDMQSHQVLWVIGGGRPVRGAAKGAPGSQAAETFRDDLRLMMAFKCAVEAQGHQWPKGWVRGKGWVDEAAATKPLLTLAEVVALWEKHERAEKVELGLKKGKSLGRDLGCWRTHIKPTFGTTPAAAITRDDVRAWVKMMHKLGAAPKSIKNRHGLLYQLLEFARQELREFDAANPCEGTRLPRRDADNELRFFTHGEYGLLHHCLRSDAKLLVQVKVSTGMRWGEISALTVGHLAWAPGQDRTLNIVVEQAWTERDPEEDRDLPVRAELRETVKWMISTTKNRQTRVVQLVGPLADDLWYHVAGRGQDEYVFTTSRGNPWRYEDFLTDRWQPALRIAKEYGLTKHGTMHMLRHTFAVWTIADGVDIYTVSRRMGHSSIQITMDTYGGLLDLNDPKAAVAMAKQLVYAETAAVLPVNLDQAQIDAAKIRPGRRGERRLRIAG